MMLSVSAENMDILSTGAESIILSAPSTESMILSALFGCVTAAAKKKQSAILTIANYQLWSTAPQWRSKLVCR
jgi:hypothetical protein